MAESSLPDMATLEASWNALQQLVPLRTIRSDDDLMYMVALADGLLEISRDNPSHPLASMFDLAAELIVAYEKRQIIFPEEARESIRLVLMERGMLEGDLTNIVSAPLVSDILTGRNISKRLAEKLAERFRSDLHAYL